MARILRIASHRIASHRINTPLRHLENTTAFEPPRHILIPCGTEYENIPPCKGFFVLLSF